MAIMKDAGKDDWGEFRHDNFLANAQKAVNLNSF
jgi:hypothetical protein